jgi:hypothetical protein
LALSEHLARLILVEPVCQEAPVPAPCPIKQPTRSACPAAGCLRR